VLPRQCRREAKKGKAKAFIHSFSLFLPPPPLPPHSSSESLLNFHFGSVPAFLERKVWILCYLLLSLSLPTNAAVDAHRGFFSVPHQVPQWGEAER
jgi:hypothetical protein